MANFKGTSLTAIMQGGSPDYIRVIIDGNSAASVKRTVSPLLSTYTLAAGLSDTVHQVELIKETDGGGDLADAGTHRLTRKMVLLR